MWENGHRDWLVCNLLPHGSGLAGQGKSDEYSGNLDIAT